MGLGRAIRELRSQKRAEPLVWTGPEQFSSSDTVRFWAPNGAALATDTEIGALPAVFRSINLYAGVAKMLPLRTHLYVDDSVVPRNAPQTRAMYKPTPNWTFSPEEWRSWEIRCRLTRGNSFFLKRGMTPAVPYPSELIPLHPDCVMVLGVWERGRLVETLYVINNDAMAFDSIDQLIEAGLPTLTRREVFHVPGALFDGVSGVSPITAARAALSAEVLTDKASAAFYKSGSIMSGFLKTDRTLEPKKADLMKQRWQQRVAGMGNAYEVAVLDGGVTFEPLTVTPADAQWIESRKFNLEQIARIFGIPPFLLMASGAGIITGGLDTQLTALMLFSFNEWLIDLESRYTMELLPSTMYARSDRSPLETADVKTLHAAFAIARQNQYMSVNEIRKEISLPLIDSEDADDPMLAPPANAPADDPGGNDGLQGGGDEAAPDVVA